MFILFKTKQSVFRDSLKKRKVLDNNHFVMLHCFLGRENLSKSSCAIQTILNFMFVFNVPLMLSPISSNFKKNDFIFDSFCESVRMKGMLSDCTQ